MAYAKSHESKAESSSRYFKSTEGLPRGTPSTMCEWNEHGESCPWRGILSPGNLGAGPWYCREHFYELRGYPDMKAEKLHGNQLPKTPLHSLAVDEMHKKMELKRNRHTSDAPVINASAFSTPIEDEETEAAFRAYLADNAVPDQGDTSEIPISPT